MDTSVQSSNRKICRACLRQYESRKDLISLQSFDQNSPSTNIRFCDMLNTIMHQNLPESDMLPSKICIMCLSSLRVSYYFRREVEKSQETLMKKLKSSNISISVKEEAVNNFPVIMRPRHVGKDAFHESNITDEVLMDTDDEIIDYEPDLDSVMDYSDQGSPSKNSDIHNESIRSNDTSNLNKSIDGSDKGSFDCSDCQKHFTSYKAMQCHKRIIHLINKCKYCQKKFLNKQQLKLHTRFKHRDKYNEYLTENEKSSSAETDNDNDNESGSKPVVLIERLEKFNECSTCNLKFANKLALVKHHAECDSKCIDCGLKIPRKDFYFKHLQTVHYYPSIDAAGYECPFCMNLFRTEKVLQDHIQRLHPDESQSNIDTMSEAGESTSTDGITLHQCTICSQSFLSSKSLKQHTSIKHKDTSSRDSSMNLGIDKKLSNNVRRYTKDEFYEKFIVKKSNDFYRCIPCRKDIYKRSLMLHIKSKHAAIRCHRCELCSEAFFRTDYRQRHFAVSHPNDYKCIECDTQFDRAYKYEAHMTTHGRKQMILKPEEGNDQFDLSPQNILYIEDSSSYDYTNDHLLMNSNNIQEFETNDEVVPLSKDEFCEKFMTSVSDKNIRCNICNVEMLKNSIVSHLLWKHALKKPLKCSFCNDRVVKNNARLAHMAKCHPNEYKCFECNVQFAKHYQYADHFRDFHQTRVATNPSTGEEDDINNNDMRFVSNRNDDEVIEDSDINFETSFPPTTITTEKKYACQFCPKQFTSPKNLLIHKSHKHRGETFEVPVQETTIDPMEPMSYEEFKQNWVEILNDSDLKCIVCEVVMRRKNFATHVKSKHSISGAYLCALCPENFYRPEHRIQHMSQNHQGIFYCNTCNIQFYRNSRYAKHMNEVHGIEIDSYDSYEVDLNLDQLKFVPFVQRIQDDDQLSMTSSTINEPDPMEGMMQMLSTSSEMSRNEFIRKFIEGTGKDRHCTACDKIFNSSTIYHHLIHHHATILPFKCPFCEVRFERTVQRSKHLQMFHPDEYKCHECGLQFSKHLKFSEHMSSEHNIIITTAKSPLETRDLSSSDLKYIAHKSADENQWQEDESSYVNSRTNSEYQEESRNENSAVMNIKSDKPENPTISYVEDEQLVEIPAPSNVPAPALEDELSYLEFKSKYMKNVDGASSKCLACNRIILKTSACAHMRLWHATSMIYNCELCPIGFRRGDYRMRHISIQHPDSYKCSECNLQFYYSAMYKEHLWTEHKIRMNVPILKHKDDIDVPLENLKFAPYVPEELRMHPDEGTRSVNNRRRNSLCIEVPTTNKGNAEDGYTYKEFYRKYVDPRGETAKCKACGKIFSKLSIKKHLKRDHCTQKPFNCELCDEGFLRIDDRLNHMRKQHPDSFKCLMCDVQFYMSTKYINHMSNEHGMTLNIASNKSEHEVDIPFDRLRFKPDINTNNINQASDGGMSRDDFTGKYLSKFYTNGELYMQCSACNKSFAAKQKRFHLIQHHAKLKPFGCELCETRFFSNFKRIKHMEVHHPNDFKCQICIKQFEKSEIYASHMQDEHKITIKVNSNIDVDINCENMLYYEKVTKQNSSLENSTTNNSLEESDNSSFNLIENLHCDVCNIDCDSSRSYRQHMRDHVGGIESPIDKAEIKTEKVPKEPIVPQQLYPCDLCDKQLSSVLARNAHKKFKHGVYKDKQTTPSQKVEIVCEICEFTSYRRDYLEQHMKQQHKGEFKCPHCKRALSSYNYYAYHVETNHFTKPDLPQLFKCSDCDSYFKIEENLQKHRNVYHGENPPQRNHFCKICTMNFRAPSHLTTHLETYSHKNLVNFFNGTLASTSKQVKDEPSDKTAIENNSVQNNDDKEITEQNNDNNEPEAKRIKMSTEESASGNQSITEHDKLDYLKYMQTTESGHFKCGICGKIKSLRKYMLHHLKQHKEVPTYDCEKCPERFVFKTKFDKHMELHENGGITTLNGTASSSINNSITIEPKKAVIEDEHPKFQEVKKNPPEIKCQICNVSFKLTIMLNKHNSTWHSDSNPFKELTMNDQKQKKSNESVPIIRFLRCEHCNEAFIKQDELENHVKTAHNKTNEEDDEDDDAMDIEPSSNFNCDRCSLKFQNIKFLENHQKFFCIHRNQSKLVNEQ